MGAYDFATIASGRFAPRQISLFRHRDTGTERKRHVSSRTPQASRQNSLVSLLNTPRLFNATFSHGSPLRGHELVGHVNRTIGKGWQDQCSNLAIGGGIQVKVRLWNLPSQPLTNLIKAAVCEQPGDFIERFLFIWASRRSSQFQKFVREAQVGARRLALSSAKQ